MRVVITIGPRDPHRDRVREDEDLGGREVLTFGSMDALDATGSRNRTAPVEHRGKHV